MASGNADVASAPASFTVPGGQTTATVPIETVWVANDTTCGFRVTDPYQGFIEDTLLVRNLSVTGLSFTPNPVVGGNHVTGTATLNNSVGSTPVTLAITDGNPALLQVPSQVTVPANRSSASFVGATNPPGSVATVDVEVQLGSRRVPGAFAEARLTILPTVIAVVPSSITVNLGRVDAGTVASLASTDGDVLRVCRFVVPNETVAPVTVQVNGTAPIGATSALEVFVRSRMTVTRLFTQNLEAFNWVSDTWDAVDTRTDNVTTTFADRVLLGSGDLTRLLRSDGSLRVRYRVRNAGPAASPSWCHEIDRLNWILRP